MTDGSRDRNLEPGVARVMQSERVVLCERRADQGPQLLLVLRAGDDQVGQLALGRQREHALVAGAVLADEARPIDGDDDRLVVLADVVDLLIERALQEGRVDGDDRASAAHRQSRRERQCVRLADPDVEEPLGKFGLEHVEARPRRHAGRDGDDARVLARDLDELLDEECGVVRRLPDAVGRRRRVFGH